MGRERWFRGEHAGRERRFDWETPARQREVPADRARALYEEALRRAGQREREPYRQLRPQAEAIYLGLLAEARLAAWRPAPGKVTRTMRRQAEQAGKQRRRGYLSPLTGQPIAPGKRTLSSYLEPPAHERRAPGMEPGMGASRAGAAGPAMIAGRHAALDEREDAAAQHAGDEPFIDRARTADPREPLALFARSARGLAQQVPYRQDMERLFGTFFGDVRAYLGYAAPLAAFGAQAAAWGEQVAFASPHPSRAQVAHELAHVVQVRRGGQDDASRALSAPDDAAEREADAVAARVARSGRGGRPGTNGPVVAIAAQPRAAVHFDRGYAPRRAEAGDEESAEAGVDIAALLGEALVQADAGRTERPTDDPAPPGTPAEAPGPTDDEQAAGGGAPAAERQAALPEGGLPAAAAPRAAAPRAAAPRPPATPAPAASLARGTGPHLAPGALAPAGSAGPAPAPGAAPGAVTRATARLLRLGETEKSMVQQSAAAQIASVEQAGAQQKAAVQRAAAALRAEVADSFAALRADIETQAQAARGAVGAARDAEKARVQEAEAVQIARIRDGVTERRARMRGLGESLGQDAVAHGRAEAQRALAAARTKASRAVAIGEEQAARFHSYDKAEEIAQTARTMAGETAREITDQGAKVAQQCREDGRALAGKLRQDAHAHADNLQIDEGAIEGIRQASQKAQEGLDRTHDDTVVQIEEAAVQALVGVDQGEQTALARLEGMDAEMLPAIDAAVAGARAGIEQAAGDSAAQLDSALAEVSAAAGSVDESRATEAGFALQALVPGVQSLGRGIRSALVMLGARSASGLVQAGAEAVAGVAASGQPILAQNEEIKRSFASQMAQVSAAARDGMSRSAGDAVARMAEAGDAVTAELDKAFEEGRASLTRTATEGKAEITGKVDQCLARMDQSLAELVPAIVKQADDIEHASWWDKLVSAVAGFFEGFFGALWDFIKDTLKVLLIVAAALIILVLLAALLVTLFPALLGPLLAGLLFLAMYGTLILTVAGYIGLAIGALIFALSVYGAWQAWNDPTLTWEEKWQAAGRAAFDVVDIIGPEKFLAWLKPLTRGTDAVDGMTDAAKIDNAGDLARADEAGDLARTDDAGDLAKVDSIDDTAKLDSSDTPAKADDGGGGRSPDNTSSGSVEGAEKLDDAAKLDDAGDATSLANPSANDLIKQHWQSWSARVRAQYAEACQKVREGKVLVRKMSSDELKSYENFKNGEVSIDEVFPKGTEGNKAFRVDETYTFQKEARNTQVGYDAAVEIPLDGGLREYLLANMVPDRVGAKMPQELKMLPRFKLESGGYTILIPKSVWDDFVGFIE